MYSHKPQVGIKMDGSLVLYVKGNLSAGDELTITYGDKCNSELMNSYGFDVPNNNVSLMLSRVCYSNSVYSTQMSATVAILIKYAPDLIHFALLIL
jgi:hypothetical protein